MGKYDNFNNLKNIVKAQKKLHKLSSRRNSNTFQIQLAQKELETAKLFETCQIFKAVSSFAPNERIMFSDDNRAMWFVDRAVPYGDIASYTIAENMVQRSYTTTRSKGSVSRAIVGGVIAGGVGAIVGAASAGSASNTTSYLDGNGFILQVFLKNGDVCQCKIENAGFFTNKIHPMWLELGAKLQMIIDENVN